MSKAAKLRYGRNVNRSFPFAPLNGGKIALTVVRWVADVALKVVRSTRLLYPNHKLCATIGKLWLAIFAFRSRPIFPPIA